MRSDYHPSAGDLQLVAVLHALADPIRLSVIRQVADGEPHACGTIITSLTPSAMTRHFRILRASMVAVQMLNRRDLLGGRTITPVGSARTDCHYATPLELAAPVILSNFFISLPSANIYFKYT